MVIVRVNRYYIVLDQQKERDIIKQCIIIERLAGVYV